MLEFKYLGCVLEESVQMKLSAVGRDTGRRVAGTIGFLVNAKGLQLECAMVFHELLLVPVLIYGSETVI